jgi:hypothetical protein
MHQVKSHFKSEKGEKEILSLYDQKVDELNIKFEYIKVFQGQILIIY